MKDDTANAPGGGYVDLAVVRRAKLIGITVRPGAAPATRYEIVGVADAGAAAARYHAWVGEPQPRTQILATATTLGAIYAVRGDPTLIVHVPDLVASRPYDQDHQDA